MNFDLPIGEIMTTEMITVSAETPVNEIRRLFQTRFIHHIPVEENVGDLLGIVSVEDLGRAAHFSIPENELQAKHVMTVSIQKISTSTPIRDVAKIFLEKRFRAMPVLNQENVLVGIITPYDILSQVVENLESV